MAEFCLPDILPIRETLRACMNCGLLKTFQDFRNQGCENCENVIGLKENPDKILIFTTLKFEGIVGLTKHNQCWRSKLISVDAFCEGAYALYIFGRIPEDMMQDLIKPALE